MAQTGFTPIQLYSSSTATNVPLAANLATGELAINITDGKLFYKDNTAAVQVIGWKVTPTTAGGTGLTSYNQGDLLYYNSGTTLTALPKNTSATRYLSNTGSSNNPAWAQVDLTNGVTGDLPYSSLAQGSALSVLGVTGNATADVASIAAGTDHQVLRRSGTSLAFGAVALNQSAAITGTLPTGNGGTGLTSFTANGIVYASSTSALATGSALKFDGTNFETTGNAFVGATNTVGSISNEKMVVGGGFYTLRDTKAVNHNTATTLFALPTGTYGTFLVTAFLAASDATNYHAVSLVCLSNTTATITALKTATNLTITLSGTNVQGTQTSGASSTMYYQACRIGYA